MNELIKELLRQAGVGDNWNEADWYSLSPKMVEKFAELILLEVRLLIADERIENDNPVVDDVLVSVLISIEKHFGVTE